MNRLESLSGLKAQDADSLLAAYGELKNEKFPEVLHVDDFFAQRIVLKGKAEEAVEEQVLDLIKNQQLAVASQTVMKALEIIEDSETMPNLLAQINSIYNLKKEIEAKAKQAEEEADTCLIGARKATVQDEKIDTYKNAIAGYKNAEALLNDLAKNQPAFAGSVEADRKRLKKKWQDVGIEMERLVRDFAYGLKEKLGEVFARVPEQKDLGALSEDQVLAYNEQTKKKLEESLQEMRELASISPKSLTAEAVKAVETQTKDLENKLNKVQAEIRKTEERGKTIIPVMIGLFNPQKQDKDKSRPGVFRGASSAKVDQWWGITEIPKGTMNDLVVSLNDERPLKVLAQPAGGSKSPDLVSKDKKFGNNYPVLNAGPQFKDGVYYLELSKGKANQYQGEVVIYKAFMTRIR